MKTTHQNHKYDLLAAAILIFINGAFVFKYAYRISPGVAVAAALGVCLLQVSICYLPLDRIADSKKRLLLWVVAVLLLTGLAVASHYFIPLDTLNVDRWSVIASFWEAAGEGSYPYYASSHLGNPPGPMPVYFVVAYPFYAAGWLSLLSAGGGVALLFYLLAWRSNTFDPGRRLVAALLLLTSAWMYWEIATRSNILTMSCLVLWGLVYFNRVFAEKNMIKMIGASAITGFLLSTRSIFALVYLVVFGAKLFQSADAARRVVYGGVVALVCFGLSFLPLYIIWGEALFVVNPFVVQSSFLVPQGITVSFFVLPVLAVLVPSLRKYEYLVSGGILFVVILIYAIYHVGADGFELAFHGSKIDLSYFIFCVPFLLYGYVAKGERGRMIERNS